MVQAAMVSADRRDAPAQVLARVERLAAIAGEDAVRQQRLSVRDLQPTGGASLLQPDLLMYRAVRLLPLRDVLGRRLGAAMEYQAGRRLAEQAAFQSPEDLLAFCREMGYGDIVVVEQSQHQWLLDAPECMTCRGLPNLGERVCHLEAGVIGRALEGILGRCAAAREVLCWANGDDRCRFVVNLGTAKPWPEVPPDALDLSGDDPVEAIAALAGMAGEATRLAEELRAKNAELAILATTDPLTGLANRRALIERLDQELERCRRYGVPLALAMLDIDDFKRVNDTYGHAAGDEVLRRTADLIQTHIRAMDLAARYGGEEFTVLFPHLTGDDAAVAIERVRQIVATVSQPPCATVSIGLAATPPAPPDLDVLLSQADRALYEAKRAGKNRVVVAA